MSRFLLSRALSAFATLILSSFAVCMLIHLIPGDPAVMQNSSPTPEQIARMRHALGLDLPLWMQFPLHGICPAG